MRSYFALVGALLLAGAAWLFARRLALLIGGASAVGRIESHEARGSDADPRPAVGSKVVVRYPKDDPGAAVIASSWHFWGLPVALAFMGCCCLLGYWQAWFGALPCFRRLPHRLVRLMPYQIVADAVLSLHVALVLFVAGGLVLVVLGNLRGWSWVNALWFRLAHLATIAVVAAEAWLGFTCPLTTLEMWLRSQARTATYSGSFIEHWLQALLFWEGPPWAFTAAYSLFGLAVAAAWWFFPPKAARRGA